MAKVTLKLRRNEVTGKQDLSIDLVSDGDALPFEHEEHHQDIVKKVLESSGLNAGDLGDIVLRRGSTNAPGKNEEEDRGQSQTEGRRVTG